MSESLYRLGPTHGRHCTCSSCAREDWSQPHLAPCGMHGRDCPPVYAPWSPLEGLLDSFARIRKLVRDNEVVVAANPADLTDEMRAAIEAAPLTTLRESSHIERGKLYVIRPGLLEDLAFVSSPGGTKEER